MREKRETKEDSRETLTIRRQGDTIHEKSEWHIPKNRKLSNTFTSR